MAYSGVYKKMILAQDVEKLAKENVPICEEEAGENIILRN